MKERPIIFNAPMVKAILEGRKTQTRRIVTVKNKNSCPYGQPGDRLWVRETWGVGSRPDPLGGYEGIEYRADEFYLEDSDDLPCLRVTPPPDVCLLDYDSGWMPSIHMPRWASRITLEVTGVRVERLQDIPGDDIFHEGIQRLENHSWHATGSIPLGTYRGLDEWTDKVNYWVDPRDAYKALWDSINGPGAWEKNPWVWVIEFKRVEKK